MKRHSDKAELAYLRKLADEAERSEHRLDVAEAYTTFLRRAYEALHDYGIDYRPIMDAAAFPDAALVAASGWTAKTSVLIGWLDTILSELTAQCRRQSLHIIQGGVD